MTDYTIPNQPKTYKEKIEESLRNNADFEYEDKASVDETQRILDGIGLSPITEEDRNSIMKGTIESASEPLKHKIEKFYKATKGHYSYL